MSVGRPSFVLPLLLVLGVSGAFRADAADNDNDGGGADPNAILSRGPYLQMGTQSAMVIVWRTTAPTLPLVRYGSSPEELHGVVWPTQMVIRLSPDIEVPPDALRLHSAPPGTYQYEAYISGLEPDTTYYYAICDNETLLAGADEDHRFRTLPVPGTQKAMRLWVVGDSGNGSAAQIAGYTAMKDYTEADGTPIDHYLHVGDMAYNVGLDSEFQLHFFDIYRDLMRNTVTWPTMGNHEGITSSGLNGTGPYYDAYVVPTVGEAGGVPSGTEGYYSFDIGDVHFICLNSHDVSRQPNGAMAQWLEADLAATQQKWLIGFWHHPPYTKGTHDSDRETQLIEMREFIMPLLEAGGVDLTLTGHSHVYERSMLLDGAYATPTTTNGVVIDDGDGRVDGDGAYLKSEGLNPNDGSMHVVAGHGRFSSSYFGRMAVMRYTIEEIGSVIFDIDGEFLHGKMLNSVGEVRDWFTLQKTGDQGFREALEFPWSATGPHYRTLIIEPGLPQLEIRSNPPASDAVVYYTTDGSEPTAQSPVYEGPLTLPPGTVVKAMSTWRNGTRQSPPSEVVVAPAAEASLEGIRVAVSDGADDGIELMTGEVELSGDLLPMPNGLETEYVGLRFADVRVPPRATVVSANVQFSSVGPGLGAGLLQFRTELAGDSAPFAEDLFDFSNRTMSADSLGWAPFGWYSQRGSAERSRDLSTIVQSVVNQAGWQEGNALAIFISGQADRVARSLEGSWHGAPELRVDYTTLSPLEFAKQRLDFQVSHGSVGDTHFLQAQYVRLSLPHKRGLTYIVETSNDLSDGGWTPIGLGSQTITNISGTGLDNVRATRILTPEEFAEGIFVRMRLIGTE